MKKVRFKIAYSRFQAGTVIGTTDSQAAQLAAIGVAEYVDDDVRPLKYAANAPVQSECVAPVNEELESAPKGASMPQYETAIAEPSETKVVTAKKNKQANT